MDKFKIGDKVRLGGTARNEMVMYEGVIVHILDLGDSQFCTIEISEGSGMWSDVKTDTAMSDQLERIEEL